MRSYTLIEGNLLDAKVDFICHQVNCQGKMGSGVAKAIRERYPKVYNEYFEICSEFGSDETLGTIQIVKLDDANCKNCINMFAQDKYGYDGRQYTSLEAFKSCLETINSECEGQTVAFPWMIGCVRGGADWNVVLPLILNTLTSVKEIQFYRI